MAFWNGFPRYISKAEKMAKAEKKLNQLKKKKQDLRPVIIEGSAIARTWWGKAWNKNLERYADYANRIGRGRSYVRCGAVLDLRIETGEIKALVHGSRAKPYSINIKIKKLNRNVWEAIASGCSGMLESLEELLAGKFPKALEEIFMQRDSGLFPSPEELEFDCSCPDWASMCKHVSAALYGVGARLDENPSLFFTLRGVATEDLVSRSVSNKAEDLLKKAEKKSARIIADADLSSVFGIDLAEQAGSSPSAGSSGTEVLMGHRAQTTEVRNTIKSRVNKDAASAQSPKSLKSSVKKSGVKGTTKRAVKKSVKVGKKKH